MRNNKPLSQRSTINHLDMKNNRPRKTVINSVSVLVLVTMLSPALVPLTFAGAGVGCVTNGGNDSTECGVGSTTSTDRATAIGNLADATGAQGTALGHDATATGTESLALGQGSRASGLRSTVVGEDATSTMTGSVAVGNHADATANNATAIGTGSAASGLNSVSLGQIANASNNFSIAIGSESDATQTGSIAIGGDATDADAIGAQATSNYAVAIGPDAVSNATSAIAVGNGATATGGNSTAIGRATEAAINGIAIGNQAKTIQNSAVALGVAATASGDSSISIGEFTDATQTGAIAIGGDSADAGSTGAQATGTESTAIGTDTTASGDNSSAIGALSSAHSYGSVSLGYAAGNNGGTPVTDSPNVIAIGNNSNIGATSADAIAIGGDAVSTAPGAIALGAGVVNDIADTMLINVPLRIEGVDDNLLLLESTDATSATRRLIKMTNFGPVGFEMVDTELGDTWQFRSDSLGKFVANKLGNTGAEFSIDSDGNGRFLGEVRAAGVLLDSSRALKTDIDPIKPAEVMEKLKQVEIAEWRYKKADKNDRHISPMAEDFYSLFKLGRDGKSINPNDLASVAIIAAKELQLMSETMSEKFNAETAALKLENTMLKDQSNQAEAKVADLQDRLASLEKLVTNLASSDNLLPEAGAKVVLMKK